MHDALSLHLNLFRYLENPPGPVIICVLLDYVLSSGRCGAADSSPTCCELLLHLRENLRPPWQGPCGPGYSR